MAPRWLRLVISWLVRVREQKPSQPKGPRRRASFPAYQPPTPTTPSVNPPHSAAPNNPAYGSLPSRQRRSTTTQSNTPNAPFYVPPGYIYHTGQGWIPVGNGHVTYTSGYQGHIGATPYRRLPNGQMVAATGYITTHNGVQQQQFYVFPQQTAQTTGQGMAQVPNSASVTLPKIPKEKSSAAPAPHARSRSASQSSATSPSTHHRPPPPPPPPRQQRPGRKPRADSAPITSAPYHASPRRIADAWARYQRFWSGSRSARAITFDNIPWPMVEPPKHPTSLTVNSVRSFLLSPHHSQDVPARERVENAQRQWEQSSFMATYGPRMKAEDKDKIERTVGFLQGTLRLLHYEVAAAESIDDGSS